MLANCVVGDGGDYVCHQAPNDTAYKRWSCQSGLKLLCKLCRTFLSTEMGARFTIFWACRQCGHAGWLALFLTKFPTLQHIEITHPNNVNLKLVFHKVASFHPHYLTFTPQTYHHPVYRFRSGPTQTTSQSHPHTQVQVQPENTYNHTYIKLLFGQNKTISY